MALANPQIDVSIVLCTRNRAADLRETLRSIAATRVPGGMTVELIVVDNNSTDETASVVKQAVFKSLELRYILEAIPGANAARNAGVRASRGRAILFTDDDLRVPTDWIDIMCKPILDDRLDAVAGGMRTADHLKRPWPDSHCWELGLIELQDDPPHGHPPYLIVTANCAYSRSVFDRVPEFDEELGPGRLGLFDDVLFARQVEHAGYRMGSVISRCWIVHHFAPERLLRKSLLKRARDQSRSVAYADYHWYHTEPKFCWPRWLYRVAPLLLIKLRLALANPPLEGATLEEIKATERVNYLWQTIVEKRRPRNYECKGLVKRKPDGSYSATLK